MRMIGLICPALISIWIYCNRNPDYFTSIFKTIMRYGIYVLVNMWLTALTITFVLGLSDVTVDALDSFPFFIKYSIIAVIIAFLTPYIEEIVRKYVKVSFLVRIKDEEKKDFVENK